MYDFASGAPILFSVFKHSDKTISKRKSDCVAVLFLISVTEVAARYKRRVKKLEKRDIARLNDGSSLEELRVLYYKRNFELLSSMKKKSQKTKDDIIKGILMRIAVTKVLHSLKIDVVK
jgi:hypothetical protein